MTPSPPPAGRPAVCAHVLVAVAAAVLLTPVVGGHDRPRLTPTVRFAPTEPFPGPRGAGHGPGNRPVWVTGRGTARLPSPRASASTS